MITLSRLSLITRTRQRDHITPVLRALHWLYGCNRIQFKVLVNVFKSVVQMPAWIVPGLPNITGACSSPRQSTATARHLHAERTSGNQSDWKACRWHFGTPTLEPTTDLCAHLKRHS